MNAQVGNQINEVCGVEIQQGQFCSLCGAWRGSLGLEPDFNLYLSHLMQIMAECKRVLKDTGTMWVNIGDSYNSHSVSKEWAADAPNKKLADSVIRSDSRDNAYKAVAARGSLKGYPDKCLIGIPERFAIRMTDELSMIRRNTIIWHKRNCMPSSANDRFTVDFEPVYFFVKQGEYWFKQQLEKSLWYEFDGRSQIEGGVKSNGKCSTGNYATDKVAYRQDGKRNRRCVWDIPTEPSTEPHFAMFPQKLVEPMLDAGCPPDGIVLDPFAGMCTVASVAIKQGKRFIMMELSPEYAGRAKKRIDLEKQQMRMDLK